jgi:hypothetical protein
LNKNPSETLVSDGFFVVCFSNFDLSGTRGDAVSTFFEEKPTQITSNLLCEFSSKTSGGAKKLSRKTVKLRLSLYS